MKSLCVLALLLGSAPAAAAVTVESAQGDWSKLPELSQRGYAHLNEKMQAKLYEIAGSGECPTFKLQSDRLDFRISFAARYDGDGTLSRLIVPALNCPEAESVMGGAVLEMLQGGDYAPTGKSRNGWYRGGLGFAFTGPAATAPAVPKPDQQQLATATPDQTEIVCEKVGEIGSRLITHRVCMSRAKWAEQKRLSRQEVDRVQTQRGCNNGAGC